DAGQLAAGGGLRPVAIELEVVAEIDLFRLRAETLTEPIGEARAHVVPARDRHAQAPPRAAEGVLSFDQGCVLRRLLAPPGAPPVVVLEAARQEDVQLSGRPGVLRRDVPAGEPADEQGHTREDSLHGRAPFATELSRSYRGRYPVETGTFSV